jgi:D-lactate dehydrogenase
VCCVVYRRASLRECEADEEMARLVPDILGADPMAAALLIECRGRDSGALQVGQFCLRPLIDQ